MPPRCVSVTERPSAVWIVTVFPFEPTVPAKEIVPAAGATTPSSSSPATSMPRC
jgi:hypothetical protein